MSTKSTIYYSGLARGDVHLYCETNENNAIYLDAPALKEPIRLCAWEEFIAALDEKWSLNIAGVFRDRRAALTTWLAQPPRTLKASRTHPSRQSGPGRCSIRVG